MKISNLQENSNKQGQLVSNAPSKMELSAKKVNVFSHELFSQKLHLRCLGRLRICHLNLVKNFKDVSCMLTNRVAL